MIGLAKLHPIVGVWSSVCLCRRFCWSIADAREAANSSIFLVCTICINQSVFFLNSITLVLVSTRCDADNQIHSFASDSYVIPFSNAFWSRCSCATAEVGDVPCSFVCNPAAFDLRPFAKLHNIPSFLFQLEHLWSRLLYQPCYHQSIAAVVFSIVFQHGKR